MRSLSLLYFITIISSKSNWIYSLICYTPVMHINISYIWHWNVSIIYCWVRRVDFQIDVWLVWLIQTFMSWYHNCERDNVLVLLCRWHTHPHTTIQFLIFKHLLWEFGAKHYFSVIGFMNIYHVNSLFFSERMWCHITTWASLKDKL